MIRRVTFETPLRAVAPGQAAGYYLQSGEHEEPVLGGGQRSRKVNEERPGELNQWSGR
jgi:hypothetical protein